VYVLHSGLAYVVAFHPAADPDSGPETPAPDAPDFFLTQNGGKSLVAFVSIVGVVSSSRICRFSHGPGNHHAGGEL
jgi:hypothetical protein